MPEAMAMADLAVFRAGATGLAELTARGVPAILVPYPYAAENHQEYNARALERAGAARVILDRDLTDKTLSAMLGELLSEEGKLRRMAEKSRALRAPPARGGRAGARRARGAGGGGDCRSRAGDCEGLGGERVAEGHP